jgi:hypothetical protein
MSLFKQKRKCRFHVKDGPTIQGVLERRTRHEYIVWAPTVLTGVDGDEAQVAVSGHVEIPRENVLFYQVIG